MEIRRVRKYKLGSHGRPVIAMLRLLCALGAAHSLITLDTTRLRAGVVTPLGLHLAGIEACLGPRYLEVRLNEQAQDDGAYFPTYASSFSTTPSGKETFYKAKIPSGYKSADPRIDLRAPRLFKKRATEVTVQVSVTCFNIPLHSGTFRLPVEGPDQFEFSEKQVAAPSFVPVEIDKEGVVSVEMAGSWPITCGSGLQLGIRLELNGTKKGQLLEADESDGYTSSPYGDEVTRFYIGGKTIIRGSDGLLFEGHAEKMPKFKILDTHYERGTSKEYPIQVLFLCDSVVVKGYKDALAPKLTVSAAIPRYSSISHWSVLSPAEVRAGVVTSVTFNDTFPQRCVDSVQKVRIALDDATARAGAALAATPSARYTLHGLQGQAQTPIPDLQKKQFGGLLFTFLAPESPITLQFDFSAQAVAPMQVQNAPFHIQLLCGDKVAASYDTQNLKVNAARVNQNAILLVSIAAILFHFF